MVERLKRPELRHAGQKDVNRAAELKPLPGVACHNLVNRVCMADSSRMYIMDRITLLNLVLSIVAVIFERPRQYGLR